jgi:hypothetical protein
MKSPNMNASSSRLVLRWLGLCASALPWTFATGCSGGGGGGGGEMVGVVGEDLEKPDGSGVFFNDANEGGEATALKVMSLSWGRLVDVHDIDEATGETDPNPVFRDFVINESIQTDGQNYSLETNPVTQKTRLVVLREKKDDVTDEFINLVKSAAEDLSPVQEKSDAPGTLPPFSFVARNAALVVRFNDLLEDDSQGLLSLPDNLRVQTDYPPTLPYQNKRLIFDPNYGGLTAGGGSFHSTRVIIDLTVSEAEAASMTIPVGLNSLGLPASLTTTQQANVSIRIPSQLSPAAGQFTLLENLSGNGLTVKGAGPVDLSSPTLDVVRALRSGNTQDGNNGFLLDLNPPELISGWPITVTSVVENPAGDAGFDFLLDLTFTSPCRSQPEPGNILELPGVFGEVSALGLPPDFQGKVSGVEVRTLSEIPVTAPALLGGGLFKRTFDAALFGTDFEACWASFAPLPGVFPADLVQPNSQITLRFSEPMDPATLSSFETFRVTRTDEPSPSPLDIVVGDVEPSGDLKEFTYTPLLPFKHDLGAADEYTVRLKDTDGITDLAGNPPPALPATMKFRLDAAAAPVNNGGIVMGFETLDEIKHPDQNPDGALDWRGQYLFDQDRGLLRPRPVVRSAAVADRSQAVPAIMIPFAPGVQTPLAPLGSKLMTVWRYCDVGFSSQDESNHNLDIEGLNWSPIGAQIVSDIYPEFEMRLSHSHYLPDEVIDANLLPTFPNSGLRPAASTFASNILVDPASPQVVVHEKPKGYVLNPVDLFLASTGTFMMPFPMNRGVDPSERVYFTWRDTSTQFEAGPNGAGIDLGVMETVGLIVSNDPPTVPPPIGWEAPPGSGEGYLAKANNVPSLGLPLLMEFRCYPAEESVGLNSFDISLAINTSRLPAFRVFSTGGLDQTGTQVKKNPDLEANPSGGFNPNSVPPGKTTPADDNSFYIGQMDVITRISRVHSIWIDTTQGTNSTDFLDPIVDPKSDQQPAGTELVFAFRGAVGISSEALNSGRAFDADYLDPYGDVRKRDTEFNPAEVPEFLSSISDQITYFPAGDKTWKSDIDVLDKAIYFQIRVTFVGNTTTLLNPELSGVGVAWAVN